MNKQPTLIRTHSATMGMQLAPGGGIPIDLPQRLIGELLEDNNTLCRVDFGEGFGVVQIYKRWLEEIND